ncbi:unnamed protein product [Mytilus coruscus]|uniref:Uncharacterized protein n=1 Tax=Mytilus coruscus TaxID=42192 RepID=A0A6J8A1N1_MYTCO|nr:unnamed protein product [Mytilus coruscus]
MYTKVLTIIALIVIKHTKGQDPTCEFPCEFRGKTLNIFSGNTMRGNWVFNDNGITSSFAFDSQTDVLTCYQRIERFIIFRVNNDKFACFIFDYNPGMTPISFSFGNAILSTNTPVVCDLCDPQGGFITFEAIATNPVPLPCGTVSYCSIDYQCGANDTLPEGCPPTTIATTTEPTTEPTTEATTESTTEATIQPTKPCHKRRHHH